MSPQRFRVPLWIGFVASRYVRRSRGNSPSPVFAILGIATGVLALTVIIAVMNGFQLGFIESILEISSYHLRVMDIPPDKAAALADLLAGSAGITAAVPFCEFQALIQGGRSGQRGILIRALPPEVPGLDPGLASRLEFEGGAFNIAGNDSILLGNELARSLGIRLGDRITLFSINDLFGAEGINTFTVTGLFRTGYYEYDTGLGLMNLEAGLGISGEGTILGLKIRNRWQDLAVMAALKNLIAQSPLHFENEPTLSTWRDYNRAFFGALRTEKLFMFILVGLIFVVVGLNIFQAQRRAVLERREEIGLLRAVGAGDLAVRLIFVWDGFLIGLTGAGAGMLMGILVAGNIAAVFSFVEGIINQCIDMANYLSGSFSGTENFAVFSPAVFYIKEIPSRLIPGEVFLIFMFGFVSALLAAWFASARAARTRPAEVLRDE